MSLKLSHKVLILVAVPVIFEIGLVSLLNYLRAETESLRQRQSHSREIIEHFSRLQAYHMQRGIFLILGHSQPSPAVTQKVQFYTVKLQEEIKKLDALVSATPGERSRWGSIISLGAIMQSGFDEARDSYIKGDTLQASVAWLRYQRTLEKAISNAQALYEQENVLQQQSAASLSALNGLIDKVLGTSVIVSLILAGGLAYFFHVSTSGRFSKLQKNTRALAAGRPPGFQVGGGDELGAMDLDLHSLYRSLEMMRQRERAVLDNASEIICMVDDGLKIEDINKAVQQVWRLEQSRVLGCRIVDLVVSDKEALVSAFARAKSTAQSVSVVCSIATYDGFPIWSDWSITWSDTEDMYCCVIHDVTQKLQIDKMKQDFVAMVSHDLRTPLATIQLVLELIQDEMASKAPEFILKKVDHANKSIKRLLGLVNNLLNLQRLESGKMDIDTKGNAVKPLVQESIDAVLPLATSKKMRIESKVQPGLEGIFDYERILQVLVNLLSNAIKFSPQGTVIYIDAEEVDDNIQFAVSDQGPGIKLENQSLLFEQFKQLSRDDDLVHKGSGLGLYICKWIVQSHGGRIWVESKVGAGSTFRFSLPN